MYLAARLEHLCSHGFCPVNPIKQCCESGMIVSDPDPTFQMVSYPDPTVFEFVLIFFNINFTFVF
jgi:hypothetical protein